MLAEVNAPAIVRVRKKSRYSECDDARAVRNALDSARGTDVVLPIYHGGKLLGWQCGSPWWAEDREAVYFRKAKPGERWDAMPFTSYDNLISNITSGNVFRTSWSKTHTTAPVLGNWGDCWPVSGSPAAGAYGGAAFTAVQHDDTNAGALWTGGNVSTNTKHVIFSAVNSSSGTPTLYLYDRVITYDACTFNASASQNFTNTLAALRYNGSGLSGMKILATCQTLLGSTASNITTLTYTNQAGTGSQTMPTTPTVATIVSAAAPTANLGARVIAPATAAATLPWGPYIPLAAGDGGVRSITNWTTSAANTGTLCFVLARPLVVMPTSSAGITVTTDMVQQIAGLERIYDGGCISILAYFPAATATTLFGNFDTANGP